MAIIINIEIHPCVELPCSSCRVQSHIFAKLSIVPLTEVGYLVNHDFRSLSRAIVSAAIGKSNISPIVSRTNKIMVININIKLMIIPIGTLITRINKSNTLNSLLAF